MEDMKKCFESKPEIGKCIKEKKMLYFSYKSGMKKKADMTMGIMERYAIIFVSFSYLFFLSLKYCISSYQVYQQLKRYR